MKKIIPIIAFVLTFMTGFAHADKAHVHVTESTTLNITFLMLAAVIGSVVAFIFIKKSKESNNAK